MYQFEDMANKNKYIGIAYEELQKLSADEIKRLEYEGGEKRSEIIRVL